MENDKEETKPTQEDTQEETTTQCLSCKKTIYKNERCSCQNKEDDEYKKYI